MNRILSIFLGILMAFALAAQPAAALQPSTAEATSAEQLIAQAKTSDPEGFEHRLGLIKQSDAFVQVLNKYTADPELNAQFFAAISTDEQAAALVENTRGKHYEISGTMDNPEVKLAPGAPIETRAAPACGKAWAAFAAWLAGTTMLCAPFSGPAAWACAVSMGFLGLMPDFNTACD